MALTRLSLLERLRDPKNIASWNEFAKEYSRTVDDYARPYCRSQHDQVDIVQNVWLSLIRLLPQFEYQAERGGFHRLLKRIVRNTAIDWFRKRKRDPQATEAVEQFPMVSLPESCEDDQQLILKRAIEMTRQRSNPMVWSCFEQHILGQRPARDVAEEFNISPNAVYVNASRVTSRIRSLSLLLQGAIRDD
jgi:RNA polymerase sigma-70 factor (ECF subfamily)